MPLPCQRKHAARELDGKRLEKRGAILPLRAFARFYATDGRNACSARPAVSIFFYLCLRLMLAHFSSLGRLSEARAASNSCVLQCMRVSEGMCAAARTSVHCSHIASSWSIVVQYRMMRCVQTRENLWLERVLPNPQSLRNDACIILACRSSRSVGLATCLHTPMPVVSEMGSSVG